MSPSDSFTELMARLQAGEQQAATAVFQRFAGRLVALARSRLGTWLRGKADPEEAVQSAYKSFFLRYGEGQFHLESWDGLWALLVVLTVRKCNQRVAYWRSRCRAAAREAPAGPWDGALAGLQEALDPSPTPEEAAVLTETVERLLRGLCAEDREILELSLQGYTAAEVGERLGLAERTVRRVRARARKRLERMQAAGAEEA
jgi:RNA polymerase sigma-70 factor (ECF subfamily)